MMKETQVDVQEIRHELQKSRCNMGLEAGPSSFAPFGRISSIGNSLCGSLKTLCYYAAVTKEGTFSEGAQPVIRELRQLIGSVLQYAISKGDIIDKSTEKRDYETLCDLCYMLKKRETQYKDVLDKAENILGASRRVRINEQGKAWG